ncbi:MAG: thiamine phosphate synthase [Cellvibrionaceae bacterium]|nr:thiamine phosphate synthase [Cellvibrionaceae bacterium]
MTLSERPTVLTIAATDSAGLAGVAMDMRTQVALGVHSAAVITATTAQNNTAVVSINPVAQQALVDQYTALDKVSVSAIKIGLLATAEQFQWAAEMIAEQAVFTVVDPVLKSSSGADFSSDFIAAYKSLLLPACDLVTPNIDEAEQLSGRLINTADDVEMAAKAILACGVGAVFIKGGHRVFAGDDARVHDYFCTAEQAFWLSSVRINTPNTRGSGCALSSAIASAVALDYALYDAVVIGKMAVSQGLRASYSLGVCDAQGSGFQSNSCQNNNGPVTIEHFPNAGEDLPCLQHQFSATDSRPAFPSCNQPSLGVYPVIDRADWIRRLTKAGVTTIQLRIKDLHGDALAAEVKTAVALAKQYPCRLFINDHWRLAIEQGAYGVHLGQEDLNTADIDRIHAAGLRLGISTHCHYEVARAHSYQPSYIACGPVYPTETKIMPWVPQGIAGLSYWRQVLAYPLVAIGGINRERIAAVAATGVDSVAMITAITLADKPEQSAAEFTAIYRSAHCV